LQTKTEKKKWEIKWSKPDFSPTWEITEIPKEIKLAVDSEWFPSGASVLDIGCGRGTIAAWFAKQNFKVLGIDWANAAIERAKSEYGEIPGQLEFQTVDICREPFASPPFEVLLDRGCFHVQERKLGTNSE